MMMTMRPLTPDRFAVRSIRGIGDLSDVRSEFGRWLRGLEVAADRIDDLLVVVSELAANAVRESAPGADLPTLTAQCDERQIELEVSNEVDVEMHDRARSDWDLDDPLRTGGRGLLVVSALVDEVDVDVDGRRLSVRCVVGVDGDQRDSTVT